MEEMKCECYCGCADFGDYSGDEFFECCNLWFCPNCFADHIEDSLDHDTE